MLILIDGYNILKHVLATVFVKEQQQTRFLQQLNAYARLKGHTVHIFFDGGQSTWPYQESMSHLNIIFSGTAQSADAAIQHFVDRISSQPFILVSNDRELAQAVSHNREQAWIMDVYEFYQRIVEAQKQPSTFSVQNVHIKKTENSPDSSLDEYMRMTKKAPVKEEKRIEVRDKKKRSKQERALLEILRKL